jgi:hypothetical protein
MALLPIEKLGRVWRTVALLRHGIEGQSCKALASGNPIAVLEDYAAKPSGKRQWFPQVTKALVSLEERFLGHVLS